MHDAAMNYVVRTLDALDFRNPKKSVLEIGSRDVNGSVRPLFAGAASYTGIDVRAGHGVDEVANGEHYGEPEAFDLVITTEVLEHCRHAKALCANALRILKPGGVFILTAAGDDRPQHGNDGGDVSDEFYRNVSEAQLSEWLTPFEDSGGTVTIEVNERDHDIYACATKPGPKRAAKRPASEDA